MLDCAVRCSTGRRLCAGLCCALQHQPEAVCWPVLVLQHTERLWRCQTQLCAVCTLAWERQREPCRKQMDMETSATEEVISER